MGRCRSSRASESSPVGHGMTRVGDSEASTPSHQCFQVVGQRLGMQHHVVVGHVDRVPFDRLHRAVDLELQHAERGLVVEELHPRGGDMPERVVIVHDVGRTGRGGPARHLVVGCIGEGRRAHVGEPLERVDGRRRLVTDDDQCGAGRCLHFRSLRRPRARPVPDRPGLADLEDAAPTGCGAPRCPPCGRCRRSGAPRRCRRGRRCGRSTGRNAPSSASRERPGQVLVRHGRSGERDELAAAAGVARGGEHAVQVGDDEQQRAARLQRVLDAFERGVAAALDDDVVLCAVGGEVLARAIDHPIGAERRTRGRHCAALHTAVTVAPRCFASCTAAVPTAPDAPFTSTSEPGPSSTWSR